ncbi:hypothetical protein ANN_17299, partial [Periplaneta americana]
MGIDELTEKHFGLLIKILRLGNVPIYTRKVSKMRVISNVFVSLCCALVYFGGWLDIIHSDDLKHIMKALRIIAPTTFIVWTEINFRLRKDVYEKLIEQAKYFSWDQLPEKDSNTGKLTAAGWTIRVHKIIKYFLISSAVLHLIQSGTRLVAFREMMFPVWYPFDILKSPIFEIVYVTQLNSEVWAKKTGYFVLSRKSNAFFMNNWGDSVDLIQAMQGYIMCLSLLAIYCFVGSILTNKCESVRDAAWASDWVGAPISHQRSLFLIIAQANHKFALTSGKFLPVSNTTMSN